MSVALSRSLFCSLALLVALGASLHAAEPTSKDNEFLKHALEKFPQADADKDGVLTMAEAVAYREQHFGKNKQDGKKAAKGLAPTYENVSYGPHERNVLDFWKANSDKPTPVVVFIHGGGFVGGDKSHIRTNAEIQKCLDRGVSFASINYRFRQHAPIQDILRDTARAIQFLRSKSGEWNIDKPRIASYGGSAGAGSSLWIAVHDDLADPNSSDPVLRESSRLMAAGCANGQATYDITEWESFLGAFDPTWRRNVNEFVHFYRFETEADAKTEAGQKILADCSMLRLINAGDPPVVMTCTVADGPSGKRGDYLHHPEHVRAVEAKYKAANLDFTRWLSCEDPTDKRLSIVDILLQKLGVDAPTAGKG